MRKQQIYNEIVLITSEIKTTGLPEKLFEAAKSRWHSERKIKKVTETFIKKNPEIYRKICDFASKYNRLTEEINKYNDIEIFVSKREEGNRYFVFDTNVISASSYFAFTFLSGIDDSFLFKGEAYERAASTYLEALKEESGSSNLSNFLKLSSINEEELDILDEHGFEYRNIYILFADVYKGKLKSYV